MPKAKFRLKPWSSRYPDQFVGSDDLRYTRTVTSKDGIKMKYWRVQDVGDNPRELLQGLDLIAFNRDQINSSSIHNKDVIALYRTLQRYGLRPSDKNIWNECLKIHSVKELRLLKEKLEAELIEYRGQILTHDLGI